MKIQFKVTLIFLSAFLVITGIFYTFISLSLSTYSYKDYYRLLEIRAKTLAKSELDKEGGQKYGEIRKEFFSALPNEHDFIYQINGNSSSESVAKEIGVSKEIVQKLIDKGRIEYNNGSHFYFGLTYPFVKPTHMIVVKAGNYFEYHHNVYLYRATLYTVIFGLIFAFLISIFLSKYIFGRLHKITTQVKSISSENLHLRLSTKNNHDELDELSDTFNDMLNRIETSFETQNNFISNASHELRTPLTAIIGEADVATSKPRSAEEYIETLKVILEQAERLDQKTKALLFLAQTGFNGKTLPFSRIRIDQLLWDVKETVEKINPASKIEIDISLMPDDPKKLKVLGNEQLLHLALSNIVSNACKYSNFDLVEISIGVSNDYVIIVVRDKGIGIPEKEMAYIYDPFFRASNTKKFEGYGIGLPLTRNILRIHQGEINVISQENRGTTVQMKIPTIKNFS